MHQSGIQKRPVGGGDTAPPNPPIVPSPIPAPKPISPLALAPALALLELFSPTHDTRSSIGFVHAPYSVLAARCRGSPRGGKT
ncbi:hypothetical protein PISMIDRAFT_688161 [Pisolithus microcarpus 441]|uniref:Uncharacterized protein n=1 Tax=Pisolithus microcarpus 441 TaxID=765257 RepID=A0A0C9YVG1_9AGAM|nr:hypothetical protein PISMIDRAFT_688161 [Pisolithus microcarpus 441]